MKRRILLTGTGILISMGIGGCIGGGDETDPSSTEEPASTPTEQQTETEDEYPREPQPGAGRYLLTSFWVNETPEDIEPYPSTEPPVTDHGVILDLFDEALEQAEWEESTHHPLGDEYEPRGEWITWEVNEEMYRELSLDFEEIDSDDEGLIFFAHEGDILVLHMDIED